MSTKVCIVTCYKDPDYVRARTLRKALLDNDGVELTIIKNGHKNILRYPEVILKLIYARFTKRPDVYLLTFRGYELLPFLWLITLGKKRIFDEFINLIEWTVYEHKKIKEKTVVAHVLWRVYRFFLKRADIILTDTTIHAKYSAQLMMLPVEKYQAIPVSTDETVFKPLNVGKLDTFRVFYYGNMLPLHGLQYVLEAAVMLKDNLDISFLFVGGGKETKVMVTKAQEEGARIEYKSWVPFDKLPVLAAQSSLCLGGPFGNTLQARMVVTGKTYQFLAMAEPTLVGEIDETTSFVNKQNCLIVPQADSQAIADSIVWAQQHPSELQAIGVAGKDLYTRELSSQAVYTRISTILEDLA